jgi:hypothetical protein
VVAARRLRPGRKAEHGRRLRELMNVDERQFGGIVPGRSRKAAQRWLDDRWRARARAIYGVDPVVSYYETPFVVDNALRETIEEADPPPPAALDVPRRTRKRRSPVDPPSRGAACALRCATAARCA